MTADLDRFACDDRFPGPQIVRLIRRAIESTRLDLKGLRVLTEASVGYRRITPVLAALAGADEVYAVGRDSAASSRKEAEEQTAYFAGLAHVGDRVTLLSTRLQAPLDTVDVVTDLPGVRPIDESILRNVADTAAVTLMRGGGALARGRRGRRHLPAARRRRRRPGRGGRRPLSLPAAGRARRPARPRRRGRRLHRRRRRRGTRPAPTSCRRSPASARACSWRRPRRPAASASSAGRRPATRSADDAVAGRLPESDALVLCPADLRRALGRARRADRRGAPRGGRAAPRRRRPGRRTPTCTRSAPPACAAGRPAAPDGIFDLLPQAVVAQNAAGLKVGEVMTRARRRGSSPLAAEQLAAAEAHAELLPKDLGAARR